MRKNREKLQVAENKQKIPVDSRTAVGGKLLPMRSKQYTADEVVELLRKRQGERTQKEFAEELGVTQQYLSDLYFRRRDPGDTIIQKLGMTRRMIYEETVA